MDWYWSSNSSKIPVQTKRMKPSLPVFYLAVRLLGILLSILVGFVEQNRTRKGPPQSHKEPQSHMVGLFVLKISVPLVVALLLGMGLLTSMRTST